MKKPDSSNNQFGIDYAFPGLCSYCHSEVAEFNGSAEVLPGVFRPVIKRLRPNFRQYNFVLNNSSIMTVSLCSECYDEIKPEHMGELMESEINGWHKEVDELCPKWDEAKKKSHMDKHEKLEVVGSDTRPWTEQEMKNITKPRLDKLATKKEKGK